MTPDLPDLAKLSGLATALLIGVLIGVERGWHERAMADGQRLIGLRSFTLIGLYGGACAVLGGSGSALLLAGLLALALLLAAAWFSSAGQRQDLGITTLIAALLTFVLGALAGSGQFALAAAAAVVTTVLLDKKEVLHRLLQKLRASELTAVLQVLVLAAVIMPLLPRKPLDPWRLISPYEFGGLVLLMAGLSFAGYLAIRIFGWQRGALLAGGAGGMVSSTAVIANCSVALRRGQMPAEVASVAMLAACGVMAGRVLVLCSFIAPPLALKLAMPALLMSLPLLPFLRGGKPASAAGSAAPVSAAAMDNPLSLWGAIQLAALLVLVLAGVQAMRTIFGDHGPLYAAAVGGIADVDAISLSLARLAASGGDTATMSQGVLIAMLVNTLVKALLAAVLGGPTAARRASLPLLLSAAAGGAVLLLRFSEMQ